VTRREKLLSGLELSQLRGIEIGPLMSPLVGKDESEVYYVDHVDQATLRAKYAHDAKVDIEKIANVDAVWGDRTLRECFPDGSLFDYVIASHVIEHVPDMLGWLREVAEVLQPGGRLLLAIPDRRFTFDYLRVPSRLSEILDAYWRRNRRPMPAQIFDFNSNAVELDRIAAWEDRIDTASLPRYVNLREAFDRSVEYARNGQYIDVHCWVFTPSSFAALLADLIDLDLLPYTCVRLYEPERNGDEFLVTLERWTGKSATEKADARATFLYHVQRLDEAETRQLEEKRKASLEATERDLQAATANVAELRNRVQALEAENAAILSSRSFRITQPLRKFAALVTRLRPRS
jgi:SAM-dependent methyltransferase